MTFTQEGKLLLELTVKAIRMLDEFKPVEITFTKDFKGLDLVTVKIPPVKKGETIEVPLWLAQKLIEMKIATLSIERELTWIGRIHWRERVQLPKGGLSLSTIPDSFYSRARNLSRFMKMANLEGDYRATQAKNFVREIVDRRTHIITELAFLDKVDTEIKSKLSTSEISLMNSLRKVIRGWLEGVYEDHSKD